MFRLLKENLMAAQERMKVQVDKRHLEHSFEIGDMTWSIFDFNLIISLPWLWTAQQSWHLGFMDHTKSLIR